MEINETLSVTLGGSLAMCQRIRAVELENARLMGWLAELERRVEDLELIVSEEIVASTSISAPRQRAAVVAAWLGRFDLAAAKVTLADPMTGGESTWLPVHVWRTGDEPPEPGELPEYDRPLVDVLGGSEAVEMVGAL